MNPSHRTATFALFILSGAAGLIYEACWSRQFGVVFGFTERAMTASVAAFFLGSALGAWGISSRVAKIVNPLKGFAVAELIAGAWSLCIPLIFDALQRPSNQQIFSNLGGSYGPLIQFLCVTLLLLPTTFALGASLPLMAELLGRETEGTRLLPWAYGLHLGGALSGLFGASFAGFVFIGVRATHQSGSFISILVGLCAFFLSNKVKISPAREMTQSLPQVPRRAYLIAALSGFTVLALQGLYFRAFSRTLQNSSYTFAAVLAVFLMCLALGSARAGRKVRRLHPLRVLGASSLVGAVLIPASLLLFTAVTHLGQLDPGDGFFRYMAIVFLLSVIVILPPVICFGAVLPSLWIHLEGLGLGFAVGRVAAVNTLTAGLGVFLVGFVLLPSMGLWGTALIITATAWASAALVMREIWEIPEKNFALITAAIVLISAFGSGGPTTRLRPGEEVEASWETAHGLLEVVRGDDNLMMRQNIHYVMGDIRSVQSEVNQGHIPLWLHPAPAKVAFLGLATGITAGSALAHQEVKSVTAVELISEVVEASRYFETHNRYFADDPRVKVIHGDAGHYFGADRMPRFDAVISDLFVPWHSQTGYLYTVEHFENIRSRLEAGGLFALWLSLKEVGEEEFRLIADSLRNVFPVVTLWKDRAHPRKVCLIGTLSVPELNPVQIQTRMDRISTDKSDNNSAFLSWQDLEHSYLGSWPEKTGALLNTVDFPRVEHWAPITERALDRHRQEWLVELEGLLFKGLAKDALFRSP